MATKKQDEEVDTVEELCGHVNRHSFGTDRKLDNMVCDLLKGHTGDHSGVHDELVRVENASIVDGREVTSVTYETVQRRCSWNDMAGTPVAELPKPVPVAPLTLIELEQRLNQLEQWNPNKPLSQA